MAKTIFAYQATWQFLLFMVILSLGPSAKVNAGFSKGDAVKSSYVDYVEFVDPVLNDDHRMLFSNSDDSLETLTSTLSTNETDVICGTPALLEDDFCDGDTANDLWSVISGDWEMEDCEFSCVKAANRGNNLHPLSKHNCYSWIGEKDPRSVHWTDYQLETRMFLDSSCTGNAGVIFRAHELDADSGQYYYVGVGDDEIFAQLTTEAAGDKTLKSVPTNSSGVGDWLDLNVHISGGGFQVTVTYPSGHVYKFNVHDETFAEGSIGLKAVDCPVEYDYVTVGGPKDPDAPCKPKHVPEKPVTPCTDRTPEFLADNFCPGDPANDLWTVVAGDWAMEENEEHCDYESVEAENRGNHQGHPQQKHHSYTWIGERDPHSLKWSDYRVEARMFLKLSCMGNAGVIFRTQQLHKEWGEYYFLGLGDQEITVRRTEEGKEESELYSMSTPSSLGQWINVNIDVSGTEFDVQIKFENGGTFKFVTHDSNIGSGSVGLKAVDCPVKFDYLTVLGPEGNGGPDNYNPCKLSDLETAQPTDSPTIVLTVTPTELPTASPTAEPTKAPTKKPTVSPTKLPTVSPTAEPTKAPTKKPTVSPTAIPTVAPTTPAPTTPSPTVVPGTPTKTPTPRPTN
eukprot:CAMPEP_0117749038 /NCGR_PEP_ID=MMETSP0947-20121206/9504_1 /TAXON_ID=44440 /ORGANISM="Chattonella subsalsa, Strain CCMP2191" /LENGTH=622 /DNA_ID=CAMNT_0005566877 /DNA_START=52 /DNA_END=1917 /DNA_ORIENTATION=+